MKLISSSSIALILVSALAACSADGTPGSNGRDGADGAKGQDGKNNDPNEGVSLVTPSKGILDREVEVSIGGSATKFDDNAKLDFGPGIEVVEVIASSPTLITAKLKIAKDAAVGKRPVTIGSLTAQDAFNVIPAIELRGSAVPQGAIGAMAIASNDQSKAFDANAFMLDAPGLIDIGTQVTSASEAQAFFLVAPLAAAGKKQLAVANLGADGAPRVSFLSAPDALEISARSPLTFVPGMANNETFGGNYATKLFRLATAADQVAIVDYRVEVDADSAAKPVTFVFGSKGDAESVLGRVAPSRNPFTGAYMAPPYDLHLAMPVTAGASNDHYVVIADIGNEANAKARITASRVAATAALESMVAHGPNAPQALGALPATEGRIVSAMLGDAAEVDAYSFAVGSTQKLQIVASSEADLEIILTKDPNVLQDPDNVQPGQEKVLGHLYPGKQFAAQRAIAAPTDTTVYAVVLSDTQGVVKTGKYTLGVRNIP